jgi:endonuclease YncB( thermonuclease family)
VEKADFDSMIDISDQHFKRLTNMQNAEKAARTNQRGVWEKYRNEFTSYTKIYRLRAFLEQLTGKIA